MATTVTGRHERTRTGRGACWKDGPVSAHGRSPVADVSVRVAWADDAEAVAELQMRAWPELYAGVLPPSAVPGPEHTREAAAAWRRSLTSPGDARNRVLVALERNRVVGF